MTVIPEQYFLAEVQDVFALTPAMRRIVLGGAGLAAYRSSGVADEWFRFLFSAEGEQNVTLPTQTDGHWVFADPQPESRWYTVRRWNADLAQLTVDVVVHGHGLATRWAQDLTPGDQVVLSSPHGRYGAGPDADWELVIADLTGLPAAGRIIEELPTGRPATAILEVPNEECALTFETEGDVTIHWIYNPTPDQIPSALAVAARSLDLRPEPGYVWMAGEAACSRDIRRYFRHELRWPASAYDVVGYWRPDAESYLKRYAAVEAEVARIYEESLQAGDDTEETVDQVFAVMESHGL